MRPSTDEPKDGLWGELISLWLHLSEDERDQLAWQVEIDAALDEAIRHDGRLWVEQLEMVFERVIGRE